MNTRAEIRSRKEVDTIKSVLRREDTIVRLGGDGGGYSMTWTADDRQLVTVIDGGGWPENPKEHHFCTRAFAMSGGPSNATFQDVPGYPSISLFDLLTGSATPYYGTSALAVDGRIYQYLATFDIQFLFADRSTWTSQHFNGAKLIYSPDSGRTWCNQDGSTPVRQEAQQDLSSGTLTFFREPQSAFSLLSFVQMGKDYQDNRDGYVYVYSPNGAADGSRNQLVMFRVPKAEILDRGAYEYLAEVRADGKPSWTRDINSRGVVHSFPRGWGINPWIPLAWVPSVVYNAPLGVYMMVSCASACDGAENTVGLEAARRPSYLGIWIAPDPWGPWTQIHEETAWMPAGDPAARADGAQIAPKWIAEDGRSFWLTWWDAQRTSGFRPMLDEARQRAVAIQSRDEYKRLRFLWRQYHPYFALNAQQVDLVVR